MACRVDDIAAIMEEWAPAETAEAGDNVGLLAGVAGRRVDSVLIALDVDEGVIAHAGAIGAGMIVAHHPFIHKPLVAVSDGARAGRLAVMAIEAGIALFASHTNLDRAHGGVNDALCAAIGLDEAVQVMPGSIARAARLEHETTLNAFARHVKEALDAPLVRITGGGETKLKKIYVVSGAGRHDIADAAQYGADCLLTGEIGYHDGFDALGSNLCVVEAGHYHTECPVLKQIEKHLQSEFQRLQYTVRTAVYAKSTCPFYYIG